jgi:Zn-dependent protease with chaperone function
MWAAHLYSGETAVAKVTTVSFDGDRLCIADTGGALPLAELDIGDRFHGAPRCIGLPDGARIHVQDDEAGSFDAALRRAGYVPGIAGRLFGNWRSAAACGALLILLLVWVDQQGAGLMARLALPLVPRAVDAQVGATALAMMDRRWLRPTELPAGRRAALNARFARLIERHPEIDWALAYRSTPSASINAFALPGGQIVLLDGLVNKMSDDEVVSVVGHELGHVAHRHVMDRLVRQAGLYQVAGVMVGDFSSMLAVALAGLQGLRFSRDYERDADAFALQVLRDEGLSPRSMADALRVLQSANGPKGSLVPEYLSTHPATAERIRAAERAADQK